MIRAGAAALALGAALSVAAPPRAVADEDARAAAARDLGERLAVVERTDAAIVRTRTKRRRHLEMRARALYKLERAGPTRLWFDAGERDLAAWRRLMARRLLRREAREIELLASEREAMMRARLAIIDAIGDLATAPMPEPGSLAAPASGSIVTSFGRARDEGTGAWLSSRGVELETSGGDPVIAVAAGEVAYAGPLRNLGEAVVVEHENGVRSVIAGLAEPRVAAGRSVARGELLGVAAQDAIYLEIRLPIGTEGFPVDPEPLLDRR